MTYQNHLDIIEILKKEIAYTNHKISVDKLNIKALSEAIKATNINKKKLEKAYSFWCKEVKKSEVKCVQ